jgi:hypothetical protein
LDSAENLSLALVFGDDLFLSVVPSKHDMRELNDYDVSTRIICTLPLDCG